MDGIFSDHSRPPPQDKKTETPPPDKSTDQDPIIRTKNNHGVEYL